MKISKLLLIIIFLTQTRSNSASIWKHKITNYERSVYQAGFQNWKIDESNKGIMYFANSGGLLEFDGASWELYPAINKILRALKVEENRIYVGGSSEFGYFEPNAVGVLQFHSISSQLKNWGGEIWNVLTIKNRVYFVEDRNIFSWNANAKEEVKKIEFAGKIDCSALINSTIYLASNEGIYSLNKDVVKYLKTSEILRNTKIVSLLPYDNAILVVTSKSGIYKITENECKKIDIVSDNFIHQNQLFSAALIKNKLALGSVQNGLFIVDLKDKKIEEQFNLENGLKNNTILYCFFDREQNLWLGLDKGIAYIDLESAIRPLFAKDSPIGTGYCSTIYNNELYLGTNQGLYKQDKNGNYQFIKGSEGQIWSLMIYDNLLFSSGDNRILIISANDTYKIDIQGVWEIQPLSLNKNKLIAGQYSGYRILEKIDNKWMLGNQIPDMTKYSGRGFMEDDIGNNFWVVDAKGIVHKVTFDNDLKKISFTKQYTMPKSIVGKNGFFRKIDNLIVVCTNDGIYQYNRISDKFIRYPQLESMLDGQKYYEYLSIDKMNNIWFVSDRNLRLLRHTEKGYTDSWINLGLNKELVDEYIFTSLLDSSNAIIAVDNAFLKVDLDKLSLPKKFEVHIRKLIANSGDSTIVYKENKNPIVFDYSENTINIHCSATNFSQSGNILYSYRLSGVDQKWSIPTRKTFKEYTNLHEGDYTFEVKALIEGSKEFTNVSSIQFRILPPWYRSTWTYIFYLLCIIGVFYIAYKMTVSKQKKIVKQKKEELILQRLLYEEEKRAKDHEIYVLQNENLKAELQYKTQELMGYVLNVAKKNEVLEDVKKSAQNISQAISDQKSSNIVKQKVIRLISHINNCIEQDIDFKVFESNFNLIHQNFFKLLDEMYPQLTKNDKILCAYLRMNLSSKEIAPLLNISVRGVEISRYRLRKKMNLNRDISLSDFMNNIESV